MPARSSQRPWATASLNTLPAEARTALGPKGSAPPSRMATAGAPAAATVRQIAPTLPGSCTPSSTTRGQPAAAAAAAASAIDLRGRGANASTPCGVTVCPTAWKARGPSLTTRLAGASNSTSSRSTSISSGTPQLTASRTTLGPSSSTTSPPRRRARRRSWRTSSLSGLRIRRSEVALGNLDQPGEGAGIAHRQVGQHLPVELHPGLSQAVHEPVVGETGPAGSGVDPHDPQPSKVPLALTPVAEGVGQRVQDGLVGGLEEQLARVAEALGPPEDGPMLATGDDATLDPGHG